LIFPVREQSRLSRPPFLNWLASGKIFTCNGVVRDSQSCCAIAQIGFRPLIITFAVVCPFLDDFSHLHTADAINCQTWLARTCRSLSNSKNLIRLIRAGLSKNSQNRKPVSPKIQDF
jgi:hypothetical protein